MATTAVERTCSHVAAGRDARCGPGAALGVLAGGHGQQHRPVRGQQPGGATRRAHAVQPRPHDDQGEPQAAQADDHLGQQQQRTEAHTLVRATNALTRCSSSRGLNGLMT